jgi:hypothetical protein
MALVLSQYPSPRTELAKATTSELHLGLSLVLKGGTCLYQPLDHRIYGCMEAKAHGKLASKCFRGELFNPNKAITA